jgi:hypothetical protein
MKNLTAAQWKRKSHWLHSLRQCCLSGRSDGIELAHTFKGDFRLGRRGSHIYVLPLFHSLHHAEHRHHDFWDNALPGADPKDWAARLDDIWRANDLEGADLLLKDMQAIADRGYLAQFMG